MVRWCGERREGNVKKISQKKKMWGTCKLLTYHEIRKIVKLIMCMGNRHWYYILIILHVGFEMVLHKFRFGSWVRNYTGLFLVMFLVVWIVTLARRTMDFYFFTKHGHTWHQNNLLTTKWITSTMYIMKDDGYGGRNQKWIAENAALIMYDDQRSFLKF